MRVPFVVQLAAPPVDGAANEELLATLARLLGVPRRDVVLVGGVSSRRALQASNANPETGHVDEEGQRLRANWLHLNRGKYAVALLFLATSGLFMIAGRKGLFGHGAAFVLLGAAVPVLCVVPSGRP